MFWRNVNWKKIGIIAGTTATACLLLVAGVVFAYSRLVQAPEVTVDRPGAPSLERGDDGLTDEERRRQALDDDFADLFGEWLQGEEPEGGWIRKDSFFTFVLFALDDHRNADVMWVVSFCTDTHEMHIIEMPRDIRVTVADRNVQRLNAAYSAGRIRDGHDEGVRQIKREIAWVIGFEVDFYVSISMNAFAEVVDLLGGVTVHVPFRMEYYSPAQNLHINLHAGEQRLNGRQAVHFARWRQNTDHSGNIGTARRGQHIFQLVEAMAREARSSPLATAAQLPSIVATYNRYVQTDLEVSNILFFAEQFLRNDVDMQFHRIPTTGISTPRWYDIPIMEETLALVNATVNPFTSDILEIMQEDYEIVGGQNP